MRLAANLSTQFHDGDWPSRIERAAACGFKAAEAQWPYAHCTAEDLAEAFAIHEVQPILVNAPVGGTDATRFGFASLAGHRDAFDRSIDVAVAFAETAGFSLIHILCGVGGDRDILLENLARAITRIGSSHTLVVEAINQFDVPGYHLTGVDDAVGVLRNLNRPNVRLMLDLYHAHRNSEDSVGTVEAHGGLIAHVQLSDHPGRGEPGAGDIDFAPALNTLRRVGYDGAVGCEFRPTGSPEACLGWIESLGFRLG